MPSRPLRLPDYLKILARFHPGLNYKMLLDWAEDGTCPCHKRLSDNAAYSVDLNNQLGFLTVTLGLTPASINAVMTEARGVTTHGS